MATPLTTLISSGPDAFTNLWDIVFSDFPTTDSAENPPTKDYSSIMYNTSLAVRAGGFTPPEFDPLTYEVKYHGVSIPRISAGFEQERTFTLKIRLDAEWDLYKWLVAIKHLYIDPSGDGNIVLGAPPLGGNITVKGYSTSGLTNLSALDLTSSSALIGATWSFGDVRCWEVGKPTFTRVAGQEAATVDTKWLFTTFIPPQVS